eukprot:531167-Pleurochrysis_carterae.AAC.1
MCNGAQCGHEGQRRAPSGAACACAGTLYTGLSAQTEARVHETHTLVKASSREKGTSGKNSSLPF